MALTEQQKEALFNDIIRLYDLAEGMIDTVEKDETKYKEQQARITIPLIEQVQESTDTIVETYTNNMKGKKPITPMDTQTIERAMRKIFMAIQDFKKSAQRVLKTTKSE